MSSPVWSAQVEAWIADDPDPGSRAELRELLDRLPDSGPELADRFAGPLRFGTAGLRGPVRAGPNGMNQAVVRAAAAGLVRWLARSGAPGPLVIAYDARHGSLGFAKETARVATGTGRPALLLPGPQPTPVLAYAVRRLDAAAGVMVTASHNPPQDNGYKVYLGSRLGGATGAGAQIAPPVDGQIEAEIRAVGRLAAVPLGPPGEQIPTDVIESYLTEAARVVAPGSARALTIAYTPLHGVAGPVLERALVRAGFAAPRAVPEQEHPDPDFPTVPFPNPEEPGAMDAVLALATRIGADLALAHDPDGDRLGVAVPTPAAPTPAAPTPAAPTPAVPTPAAPTPDGWRVLNGDELGVLLADHMIERGRSGRYVTTVVSGSLLGKICAARRLPFSRTLTGFKWIVRAGAELAFGYEEALGYCVAPEVVRDKDGITAALLVCELAARLRERGETLTDRLDQLAAEFGVFQTGQLAVRLDTPEEIAARLTRVRANPPARLLGEPVTEVTDYLPETDMYELRTTGCRVVFRPSGTEPKLKAYLEVMAPAGADPAGSRAAAREELERLRQEIAVALGD